MTATLTRSAFEAQVGEALDKAMSQPVIVTKHGKPKFRIVALDEPKPLRPAAGFLADRLTPEEKRSLDEYDWFAPDEEIERLFGMRE